MKAIFRMDFEPVREAPLYILLLEDVADSLMIRYQG